MKHLLQNDFDVRAASRHAHRTSSRLAPSTSGLTSLRADVHNEAEVAAALEGAHGAINAVSLYVEHGGETFVLYTLMPQHGWRALRVKLG